MINAAPSYNPGSARAVIFRLQTEYDSARCYLTTGMATCSAMIKIDFM